MQDRLETLSDITNPFEVIPAEDMTVKFYTHDYDIESYEQMDGYAVAFCKAGGDWETPVYSVFYIDAANEMRLYIPRNGNTFNIETNTAYGSEGEATNNEYNGINNAEHIKDFFNNVAAANKRYKQLAQEAKADMEQMKADITNHIIVA